jgi:hypothetical protein
VGVARLRERERGVVFYDSVGNQSKHELHLWWPYGTSVCFEIAYYHDEYV